MTEPDIDRKVKERLAATDLAVTAMVDHFNEEDHIIVTSNAGGRHHITSESTISQNIRYALEHLTRADVRSVDLDSHLLEIWVATPPGAAPADRDKRWTARLTVDDSSTLETNVEVTHYGPKS